VGYSNEGALITPSQIWMLLETARAPQSPQFNVPIALRLGPDVTRIDVLAALDAVCRTHSILRSIITIGQGPRPFQMEEILDAAPNVTVDELGHSAFEFDLNKWMEQQICTAISPLGPYPLRAALLRLPSMEWLFLLVLHHIAVDGYSVRTIAREFIEELDQPGFLDGGPRPPQFADWVLQQTSATSVGAFDTSVQRWLSRLHDAAHAPPLPFSTNSDALDLSTRRSVRSYDPSDAERLRSLMAEKSVPPVAVFCSVLLRWLQGFDRLGPQVVAVQVDGRSDWALTRLVGPVATTLPLLVTLEANEYANSLLYRVTETFLDACEDADAPLHEVLSQFFETREPGFTLSRILLTLDNESPLPETNTFCGQLEIERHLVPAPFLGPYDVVMNVRLTHDRFSIEAVVSEPVAAEKILNDWDQALSWVMSDS
jgi:Condensation domain